MFLAGEPALFLLSIKLEREHLAFVKRGHVGYRGVAVAGGRWIFGRVVIEKGQRGGI